MRILISFQDKAYLQILLNSSMNPSKLLKNDLNDWFEALRKF